MIELWKSGDWLTLGLDATDELNVSAGEASGVVDSVGIERRGVKGVAVVEKRRAGEGGLVGLVMSASSEEKLAGGRIWPVARQFRWTAPASAKSSDKHGASLGELFGTHR